MKTKSTKFDLNVNFSIEVLTAKNVNILLDVLIIIRH